MNLPYIVYVPETGEFTTHTTLIAAIDKKSARQDAHCTPIIYEPLGLSDAKKVWREPDE